MRLIIIIIAIFFQTTIINAQDWEHLRLGLNQTVRTMQTDTINHKLYVGGGFVLADSNIVGCMTQWDNIGWSNMQYGNMNSMFSGCGQLFTMAQHQNHLHVVAAFHQYNQVKLLGRWNGTSWDSLSTITGTCRGLYSYGDTLYVLGENLTTDSFSNQRILGWDGMQWFSVINESFISGWIKTAHWYKGKLYVGGAFETSSGIDDFAVLDGQILQPVGGGFLGGWTAVGDLVIYQGDLYVGGDFRKIDGNPGNNIARWNGNQWLDVGGGTGGVNFPSILDMDIYNEKLYVCGAFLTAGGIPANKVARWDGQNWCGLGSSIEGVVSNLEFYRDTLVIGFMFNGIIDGIDYNFIAKWNRGDYVDTCTNLVDNIIVQKEENVDLKIYPNPSTGVFNLEFGKTIKDGWVSIYSMDGRFIKTQIIMDNRMSLNLSAFAKGTYILKVISSKNAQTKIIQIY